MQNKNWESDVLKIREHYQGKIQTRGGVSAKSLDWRDDERQDFVFQTALAGVEKGIKTVFDVGCGSGDLYIYLKKNNFKVNEYTGVDIVPEFVEYGTTKNNVPNLFVGNFLDFVQTQKYDLVINLGGLNSNTENYEEYLNANISKMIQMSKKYVVFNIITGAEGSYFPKHNHKKVGHITSISESDLMSLLARLKHLHPKIKYQINNVTIFPGSIDTFVRIAV